MEIRERFRQIIDRHEQEMLDGSGRSLDRGGRERCLVAGRKDDAVDAGRLGRSKERTEVLGILERVQDQCECRLMALDRASQKIVECRKTAPVGHESDALMTVESGQRGQRASLQFDDWDAEARGMKHELLERLAALRHDQQTMGCPPGEECLFDWVATGDQFFFLADQIGRRRAAWRSRPMGLRTRRETVGTTRPRCSRARSEGTAVVPTRSFWSPNLDGVSAIYRAVNFRAHIRVGSRRRNLIRRRRRGRDRRLHCGFWEGGFVHSQVDDLLRVEGVVLTQVLRARLAARPKAETSSGGTRAGTKPGA